MSDRIDRLEDALRSFGYVLDAEPSLGSEELFADKLDDALTAIERTFRRNAEKYGYRGHSKRAITALHTMMPNPCFGVRPTK
jgi:hypothetical protein